MPNQHELTQQRIKGPTQRQLLCQDPNHFPGKARLEATAPGMYEHHCPACDRTVYFTVPTVRPSGNAEHGL